MSTNKQNSDFDVNDLEAVRAKYKAERDKRVRREGNDQYVEVTGDFSHLTKDPNVEANDEREPLNDDVEVAIVGGGFAGLFTGMRLREAGISDFRIIDAAADFGGTWYWNRYPGAQCDIESYCYLPLLEELDWMPKEKYSYASEIYEHCQRIAKKFDLYKAACFQTKVTDLSWDAGNSRWIIKTNRGDVMRARFVVVGTGPFNQPKLPSIPGIGGFQGHTFHTSRWDYNYTGGSHSGGLHKLADKRVAIIGTGCTAIQCVPHLADSAQHLYVFQRTPSSVDERNNRPTDLEWVKSLKPGWQRERRKNFNDVVTGKRFESDMVNDGWGDIFRILASLLSEQEASSLTPERISELAETADLQKMNSLRERVDDVVTDPNVAASLKAWYRQYCKRPTFSDNYLPTFNRPNVTLVDTSNTAGVERVTPTGIIANGEELPVDCIIFSTGFEVGTLLTRRSGFEITGCEGVRLTDYWSDGGIKTFHGFHVHGFPNCFIMGPSQKGVSVNYTSMIDDQAQHISYIINRVKASGGGYVEAKKEAETQWVSTIRELALDNLAFFDACTPGYYNNEGHIATRGGGLTDESYGPGANAFNELLAQWRDKDDLEGLEIA